VAEEGARTWVHRLFTASRNPLVILLTVLATISYGEVMTRLEVISRDWAESKDAQKQIALVQYGYGKPADKIETNLAPKTILRLYYAHERPDWQQPDRPIIAVNSEGTRRPLLPDVDQPRTSKPLTQ
jgi:hypothetical protein